MQLTLSCPECHTGQAQLHPSLYSCPALFHAYPWSGCSKVTSKVPAGAPAAWIQRMPRRVGRGATLETHLRADPARHGCPCRRWRSRCGGRERGAVRGEPGCGPALQSARARPGPGFAVPPPGKGASRRAPPRAASGRVAWTPLPWQPELEAFPARPRQASRRPSSRRVPTPKIAFPRRRGSPPSPQ